MVAEQQRLAVERLDGEPVIGSGWAMFPDSYRYAKQAEIEKQLAQAQMSKEDRRDPKKVDQALTRAKDDPRPSFLAVRTVIGRGAPGIEGTAKAHLHKARATLAGLLRDQEPER